MPSLPLPRFLETHQSRLEAAARLEGVVREAGGDLRTERPIARDPSDARTLRGIPCVSSGIGGAVAGTQPEATVCRRALSYVRKSR